MKVALIIDNLQLGGGQEHLYQLCSGMKDINFGIFAKPGNAIEKFSKLKNVEIFDAYNKSLILQWSPDIIHFHHLKPLVLFYKDNFLIKTNYKTVFTLHGLHIRKFLFKKGIQNKLLYLARFILEKNILNKVDKIISVSQKDCDFIRENYKIVSEKIAYIPNGVDFDKIKIKRARDEIRSELGIPRDNFIFLTVARFDFQKAYDILVKAVTVLKYNLPNNVKFVFVGDGPELQNINEIVKKYKIQRFILFTGKRNDVYDIMNASDVFILPSRWEGLPITLIEAGYIGLPIIASSTFGIKEIINNNETGILFKNEDYYDLATKIKELLEGKYNLKDFTAKLKENIIERFNIHQMTTKIKEIYDELYFKGLK